MPIDRPPLDRLPAPAFIDELRLLGALPPGGDSERVLSAFANVSRYAFAGPGPWTVRSPVYGLATVRTLNDDPRWLDHCVLVALDEAKGINIGEPSMWARLFARTVVPEGARILQVGAGVGYYTAILKQIVGDTGSVLAFEVEKDLAERAKAALSDLENVEVRCGNAATDLLDDDGPFDLVVAFAGITHPIDAWSSRLSASGRLLFPATGTHGRGAMMLAEPCEGGFDVLTLGPCGFYDCSGARDEPTAQRLDKVIQDPTRLDSWRLKIRTDGGAVRFEVDGQVF